MRTQDRTSHTGVAFVLSGGASLGAINGALLASRGPTLETVDELAALWCGLRRGRALRRARGRRPSPAEGQVELPPAS